jgi:hypothetical protein
MHFSIAQKYRFFQYFGSAIFRNAVIYPLRSIGQIGLQAALRLCKKKLDSSVM